MQSKEKNESGRSNNIKNDDLSKLDFFEYK
jgi:hypothetical protein